MRSDHCSSNRRPVARPPLRGPSPSRCLEQTRASTSSPCRRRPSTNATAEGRSRPLARGTRRRRPGPPRRPSTRHASGPQDPARGAGRRRAMRAGHLRSRVREVAPPAGRRGSSPSPYGRCRRTRSADPTPRASPGAQGGPRQAMPVRRKGGSASRPSGSRATALLDSLPVSGSSNRTGRVGNGQQPAFQCPNGREEPNREQTALSGWDDQPPGLRSRRFIRAVCAVNVIGLWEQEAAGSNPAVPITGLAWR